MTQKRAAFAAVAQRTLASSDIGIIEDERMFSKFAEFTPQLYYHTTDTLETEQSKVL